MNLIEIVEGNQNLSLDQLKTDEELVLEIQVKLNELGLYPGGRWLDGDYGLRSEKGLIKFCAVMQLDNMATKQFDAVFAEKLLNVNPTDFRLETARNKEEVFQEFFEAQPHPTTKGGVYLDSGIAQSPFKAEIDSYPQRLKEKPDGIEVTSLGDSITLSNGSVVTFSPYPIRGKKPDPDIDNQALEFLHSDIKEACICIGSFVNGEIKTHWLGKKALNNVEFWSATKFIPILNVVCQANSNSDFPGIDIDKCVIRSQRSTNGYGFNKLVVAAVSYNFNPSSSNSIAATFKRFSTFAGLEQWVKDITGNQELKFRGNYGENPMINSPELVEKSTGKPLLIAAEETQRGDNSVSAYDLTRLITMLGWHHHLSPNTRLPGAQWDSLESVVRGMGTDIARYMDAAIERLGLQRVIKSPVIISKTGWGRSNNRDRFEITYTAFIQFIDNRPKASDNPAKLRTLAITLRAAKDLNNEVKEERELDARMATEVTEILRRVVTEELA
jgi:hypothetical protein